MKKIILATILGVSTLFAQVDEPVEVPYIPFEIKMGKGFDAIQANCLMCHSFGYITNQGPQSRKHWHEKVVKMVVHFKAPITDEDVEITTNYLFEHYGNGELE
ncbi:MAG: sulfite:cytochrome C oxidoreductase subunit B [Sulfurimonas sp.]|jgi:hypothetical protein|nr:sulfite:cytochrome C oxidoreductase subunit B [Sulfurimonas sp.]